MENVAESDEQPQRLPPKVYAVGALTQFAVGLYRPFLLAYMIDMGASYAELGAFQSVGNAAPSVLQPAWGATSDKVGRTKGFVAFGTFAGLVMIFLFLWAGTPTEMLILFAIQSVLFSIQIPTWQSLLGGLMDEENRGIELGRLGVATNVASLTATLVSGFIAGFPAIIPALRDLFGTFGLVLFPTVEVWREAYYLPFYFTAVFGIIASLLSLTIREGKRESDKKREFPPILKLLSQPGDFRRFCLISVFFSFSMSMAWPYFMVVQKDWLNSSNFEIAIASVVMTATIVIFTIPLGSLSDRIGRKPLILIGRAPLFVVPILYAFATNVYFIYVANALAGFCIAAGFNAITAYIYDIAPEEERGAHLAVFNTFTGIIYFLGSLFSGVLGDSIATFLGGHFAVFAMLMMSGISRLFSSSLYLRIREPREYSSNMRDVFYSFINRRKLPSGID
ncbi:MAG: MFS transporter [Candidatus Thorarchaeota archaeon]|jgi:MFS family permease